MKKIFNFITMKIVGPLKWERLKFLFTGRSYDLTSNDREFMRVLMRNQTLIWLSRRESHLSTYAINFSDWLLTLFVWVKSGFQGPRPKFSFYSHAFINDGEQVIEATGKGVNEALFDDVFNCDAIAILRPLGLTKNEWDSMSREVLDEAKRQIGKPYDGNFDLNDESKLSCIELIRIVLKKRVPLYEIRFRNFEHLVKTYKNVTPHMLYDSKDFVIVWEVRR